VDLGEQARHQGVRRVRRPADQDRHRVAHAALELPGQPAGLDRAAPLGRLADEDLAVGRDKYQRRDLGAPAAQLGDLDAVVDPHRRRGVRGA
jgi:hypothetical protein